MASTYSDLKIELIGTGEQSGTWGATTNTNLGTAIEDAITGSADVTFSSADVTLTLTNTNAAQTARNLRLVCVGTSGGARQLILGSGCQINKLYLVQNDLADSVTVKNTTGTGVTVPAGKKQFVFNNGTNVVEATTATVNLASDVTGTLPVANGGTGQTTYTNGQLLIGNSATNGLAKATLTAGSNITITNGNGSITIASTSGSGDVTGPASSVDNGVALFSGTGGKTLKSSASQDGSIHGHRIGRGNSGTASNTAFGQQTLDNVTTATGTTAIGYRAGRNLTSGAGVTAIGSNAANSLTTGTGTYVGAAAGSSCTTGLSNTYIGGSAGQLSGTGDENTGVGNIALAFLTTGEQNTAIGSTTGNNCTTGSNNLFLGRLAGSAFSPFNVTTESNRVVVGDTGITNAYIQVAWTVVSDARDKADVEPITHGVNLIEKLRPVTFRWDNRSSYFVKDDNGNIISKPTPDGSKKNPMLFSGFLAQEVQAAIEEVGYPNDIIIDNEDPENLKLKETALIPVLVNAVKELKAELDSVKAELAVLKG